ncbi:IkappaB kinase complex, IKAP component [Violaceomyces palustris]|uniref:IkappaB kinase complex, IKAP component n=1 Tax=Violaceomyces palustris TaxID=1673888 RepID=A0ACD0NRA6_9BASI|nr:IkappaB kinase complex, IKAP component [Violaceomyces palustris]
MRNLSTLAVRRYPLLGLPSASSRPTIQATAISTEDDTLYAAAVSPSSSPSSQNVNLCFLRSDPGSTNLVQLSSILVPASPPPIPGSAASIIAASHPPQVISLHYLSDGGSASNNSPALCAITAGGDLILIPLPEDETTPDQVPDPQPEIVGSVEQGLLAAAWSPDDELLVLITSQTPEELSESGRREGEKILLMTRDFEVLSEKVLSTDDFGEERPVDVGWGSKATQFHGSEGKAAAAAAAAAAAQAALTAETIDPRGPQLPDDDGRPRISWRGDGAFFAVTSLEPFWSKSRKPDEPPTWHRVIRTFARLGALSATSDANVRGISHAIAFRPFGNLIASSQRFGASTTGERWAAGREGRHDIVFFERNGLRHGEFSLREEGAAQPEGERLSWGDASYNPVWSRPHSMRELCWNSDGSSLAVWLSRHGEGGEGVDVVQIWTTGNYHWYLKQEILAHGIRSIKWHPENAQDLFIASTHSVERRSFFLEECTSGGAPPHDAACAVVADGAASLLTPFRLQNVPPPMCTTSLLPPPPKDLLPSAQEVQNVARHYSWAQVTGLSTKGSVGLLAILFPLATVQIWAFEWGVLGGKARVGGRPVPTPRLVSTFELAPDEPSYDAHQIAVQAGVVSGDEVRISIAVLGSHFGSDVDEIRVLSAQDDINGPFKTVSRREEFELGSQAERRLTSGSFADAALGQHAFFVHEKSGQVLSVEASMPSFTKLGLFCPHIQVLSFSEGLGPRVVGLAPNGRLYANSYLVARDATSFAIAGSFLVWTNSAHEARFLPVAALPFDGSESSKSKLTEEAYDLGRRVERGSRIVTAVPSNMSLVLQMPRGNLETICPRPLILEVVRRNLDKHKYGAAFRTCRTHRMDVNILHDHDPQAFMDHLSQFVSQVADVDHINLFLSGLRNEDVTTTLYKPLTKSDKPACDVSTKVNRICDAVRGELERVDRLKYVNSILTTHVRKVPADYEAGLSLLLELKAEDQALAEEAVKYIIFLADADKLFDLALGMYDFTLTLMIAQHAKKKDPREYLPFLRELRSVEPFEYQRFRIDDHLKRHGKALAWLAKAGKQHHQAALDYMEQHKLYEEGLSAWAEEPSKLKDAQELYGDYLVTRRKYLDAALAYKLAGKAQKALEAYKELGSWQDIFAIALSERPSAGGDIGGLAREVGSSLEERSRYAEAARVYLDYARDVELAVGALGKGNDLNEARRICLTYSRPDLIETHVKPSALEIKQNLMEELEEMTEQLEKQVGRLNELRTKKQENPAGFYLEDDPALENLDVMSDTSTQMTQFTRYTVAASTAAPSMNTFSSASTKTTSRKHAAKLKKKEEKKKAGGKKGSIYEEDYLYESIQKLFKERLAHVQTESSKLIPNLILLSSAHRQSAKDLQKRLTEFEQRAENEAERLWKVSQEEERKRLENLFKIERGILDLGGGGPRNVEDELEAGLNTPASLAQALRTLDRRPMRTKMVVSDLKYKSSLLDGLVR